MQRVKRFLNPKHLTLLIFAGFLSFGLSGAEIPLETKGFDPVQGGSSIAEGINLYVASFDEQTYSANNSTDIVIIDSVISLVIAENDEDDDDTYVFAAIYRGHHTESGTEQDVGRMLIETPYEYNNLHGNGAVGFFRKSGPWVKTIDSVPNPIADVTGTLTYKTLEKIRDVDIRFNAIYKGVPYMLAGSPSASVLASDNVTISSWSADEGSDLDFSFSAVGLVRTGNHYDGFIRRTDDEEPEEWTTRYALLRIIDINDSDADGIPDFSDLGSASALGMISTNSISTGNSQTWSDELNTMVTMDPGEFWLYGENLGWFYLSDQDDPSKSRLYIPDENLGWLWTDADLSPYYVRESDSAHIYFEVIDGQVWYYDYAAQSWFTPVY